MLIFTIILLLSISVVPTSYAYYQLMKKDDKVNEELKKLYSKK